MNTKNPLLLSALVFIWLLASCSADKQQQMDIIDPVIDYNAIHTADNEPGDYVQILLKMSVSNIQGDIIKFGLSTPEQHQERLNYFIRDFKQNISLVSNTDTISCTDSHMERLYMDLPYRNFVLTFKKNALNDQDQLLISDPIYSKKLIKLSIQNSYE